MVHDYSFLLLKDKKLSIDRPLKIPLKPKKSPRMKLMKNLIFDEGLRLKKIIFGSTHCSLQVILHNLKKAL